MNLQEKLERMATTASERRLLKRWLEDKEPDTPRALPADAADTDELQPVPPAATGTDGG